MLLVIYLAFYRISALPRLFHPLYGTMMLVETVCTNRKPMRSNAGLSGTVADCFGKRAVP